MFLGTQREIGEGLALERVALPAHRLDRRHRHREAAREHRHQRRVVTPAAGDETAPRRCRHMLCAQRDGRRGHRRQGSGPVLEREALRHESGEGVAVQGFGRVARKIGMGQEALHERLVDPALARERALEIGGGAGALSYPIIDRRVAGPGVEGEKLIRCGADPSDVGDAADIDDGERMLEPCREGGVIERHQGRALAARRDIGRAEIAHHIGLGEPRQKRAIAQLPGAALIGCVEDGVAVKADEVDGAERMAFDEALDRFGMRLGQAALQILHRPFAAQGRAQRLAQRIVIGQGQPRPRLHLRLAIALDEGRVDAVERGAAHQPDDARKPAHGLTPTRERGRVPDLPLKGGGKRRRICPSPSTVLNPPQMPNARSTFLAAAEERGFIHQVTDRDALEARLRQGPITAYIGFDCTADSLHVGSLLQIMLLRLWQKTGNRPIVLMGGGTTKVGDPSGKDETRKLLTEAEIAANMAGIRRVFDRFLRFGSGPSDAVMVNNADWLDQLNYIAFLRDYGRHFSVNRMLGFDSVKLRLEREQPLSFLEFNYMVLQAYDFLELARRHDCAVQMGGSDQWGNIVSGVELGRRIDERALYGVTSPLITTASGAKMGKTAQGAVWLNAERLSAYDYWQFWRNTEDADVGRF